MQKKNIYITQFATGTSVNLLPLAAGQLVARLKLEKELLESHDIGEIIFRRPDHPADLVAKLENVAVMGFSCFLWNMEVSLQTAAEVRKKFPEALIILGGSSVPKDPELTGDFFAKNSYVDVICTNEEGEEVFAEVCKAFANGEDISSVKGIAFKNRETGEVLHTPARGILSLADIPSPYLDGTFDSFYQKYKDEFSGIIWETNRGCPFTCSFCTWGAYPSRKIREKPMEQVEGEIEWIGRNNIKYIAMADANFGVKKRDIDIVQLLVDSKKKYGVPNFIAVSWLKNSSDKVLVIGKMLKEAGIGFRVTLSLQSTNDDVLKAVNRSNIKQSAYAEIKKSYQDEHIYSYTELIFGLPKEDQASFLSGLEESLSPHMTDQVYIYPCFLFPNTELSSSQKRKEYGIESRMMENRYTKSLKLTSVVEYVEIVVANNAMPREKWVETFIYSNYVLGLHDDRLAFFILTYLKETFGIRMTELIIYARELANSSGLPVLTKSFKRLEDCARGVQEHGSSHLIEPELYGGIPYDPAEAIFLELLTDRDEFYAEFLVVVREFLRMKNVNFDDEKLADLFKFQEAVMANFKGPKTEFLDLLYDWVGYFAFTFNLERKPLVKLKQRLRIVDPKLGDGTPESFLRNHFDVRGVPPFYQLFNEQSVQVFPPPEFRPRD